MANTVKAKPDQFHSATPHLVVHDGAKAIEFYKRAFGAEELCRMPGPDGKGIMHAEVKIGDSIVMISEECPMGTTKAPRSLGGTSSSIYLYVDDVDALFARAIRAGGQEKMPLADQFWGDRAGRVLDPLGHEWMLATHKEDLTPEQMAERAKKLFASLAAGAAK